MRSKWILILSSLVFTLSFLNISASYAFSKGIYITSSTAQSTKRMKYLIKQAKATGIDTFVIDVYGKSKRYSKNIALVRKAGIRYVARVVVFPYGGTHAKVTSRAIWEKRWKWAKYAVSLGASAIQLDYIRYHVRNRPSDKNAHYVHNVIKFFRNKLKGTGVRLQIDIFGIAATRPARGIGQNVPLFANSLDAINPMVYPSHYEPYRHHAVRPYSTVLHSIQGLKRQLKGYNHVKINAFIELYNYRYPMSRAKKIKYIQAQIQAAKDAGANGWYAWSAQNKYGLLFYILKHKK